MAHPRGDERLEEDTEGAARRSGDERGSVVARAASELGPRYSILQRVRSCGYWTVCAARDARREGRVVLVSLIDRHGLDPDTVAAVERGLGWGREIVHPHVVPVIEHGSTDDLLWFATRNDVGRPLGGLLRAEGPWSPSAALRLARQISSSLVLLHRRERVHGALCPSNVLVDEKDRARLTNLSTDVAVLLMRLRNGAKPGLVGAYAAPEVLEGGAPTPLSDQYSAARLLLDCLGGQQGDAPPVLARALSERPADRYPDISSFLGALSAHWGPQPAPRSAPREKHRPPVVLVPTPPDPEELVEEAPPAGGAGRRLLSKGAASVITAAGLFGAFLVGQTAFAGVEPAAVPDADAGRSPGGERGPEPPGFVVYAPPSIPDDSAGAAPEGSAVREEAGATEPPTPEAAGSTEEEAREAAPARPQSPRNPPAERGDGAPRESSPPPRQERSPTRTPAPLPSELAAEATAAERFGRLFMNAFPWGTVYLDGRRIGTTPIVDFPLRAGTYVVRVEREGFLPWEERVSVEAGGELRRTGIVLERRQSE